MTDGSESHSNDMTSSVGIMTLTRTPCELDKMSLFQDLKLKRRKVDSRCSSDGESVADTSTSSPDLTCPTSPKMSSELTLVAPSPQSPDSLSGSAAGTGNNGRPPPSEACPPEHHSGGDETHDTGVFDGGGGGRPSPPPHAMDPPSEPPRYPAQTPPPQSVIRPPQHCASPKSVSQQYSSITRNHSVNHQQRGTKRPHSPAGHPGHVIQAGSVVARPQSPPANAVNVINISSHSPTGSHAIHHSPLHFSPESHHLQRSTESPQQQQQQQQQQHAVRQSPDPQSPLFMLQSLQHSGGLDGGSGPLRTIQHNPSHPVKTESPLHASVRRSPVHVLSPRDARPQSPAAPTTATTRHTTSSSPIHTSVRRSPVHLSPGGGSSSSNVFAKHGGPASPAHSLSQSPRQSPVHHPAVHLPPCASPRLHSPLGARNTPGVITSQHAAVIQSQFWVQNSRINGVKPELIGGNFASSGLLSSSSDMKPPLLVSQRSPAATAAASAANPQVRQTPTVIMGEVGGVRTMIWSQPPVNVNVNLTTTQNSPLDSPQMHASTSNWSSSSSSNSTIGTNPEESAAQMLLNLGQDRSKATPSRTILSSRTSTAAPSITQHIGVPLNMERLWAGDLTQLPANQQLQALNLSSTQQSLAGSVLSAAAAPLMYLNRAQGVGGDVKPQLSATAMTTLLNESGITPQDITEAADEDDQPMICMICEDKATGLHYGIITCEGCKGFFKRTVQNRRVYTCVADGNCEITKAQRNRCQYCRFKKCIEQGMVLQAVREDRMPGGRNSGAVYNLYKVKYKKHKKTSNKQTQQQKQASEKPLHQVKTEHNASIPAHLVNGTILKTALTNPSEVVHLRQRLDNAVSSSRDRNYSIENILSMIQTLIDCDEFQDIATLQNIDELLDNKSDLSEKLCQIGDSIVYKLVQWTKRLPFYLELPVEVHTRLLTHKWHELLVLTTSAYQAIHGPHKVQQNQANDAADTDFTQEVSRNLCILQTCLTSMMGRPITMDQLRQDVGLMVEKITHVTLMFRRIRLTMHEYVCLKVITMLNQGRLGNGNGSSSGGSSGGGGPGSGTELEAIQDRYTSCLRALTQQMHPQQPQRFHELLVRLPEIQSAAALLLESKMFYVPFLLNSAIQR